MRFPSRVRLVFFFALMLMVVQAAMAANSNDRIVKNFDDEDDEKPWVELETQLPVFPQTENLISFKVGTVDDMQFALDSQSLSVREDGVIRFILVTTTSTGAKNISYEGMRCSTGERRYYASGRSDNTWSKARSNQWVKIKGGANSPIVELFANYFCPAGAASVTSSEEAIRVLRRGGVRYR